jgi:hypothetical protein
VALVLLVFFVLGAVSAVYWVNNEWGNDAALWRYGTAISASGVFLVGAVIAKVGAALVETLHRVRASLLDAILETRPVAPTFDDAWPESEVTR